MHWNFQSVKCLDKLVEENDGRKSWGHEEFSLFLIMACHTQTIKSLSKLWQFWKWQAEIPDTQLGLTGIAIADVAQVAEAL